MCPTTPKFALSAFALCLSLTAGCERASPAPDAKPLAEPAARQTAKIEFIHPTTADELAKVVTVAFNAGDKEALDHLMFWGDATEEQKRESAARVFFADMAGERRVLETKILPPDRAEVSKVSDGIGFSFALPLTEVLNVTHGNDSSKIVMSFRIGELGEKYYLAPGYDPATLRPHAAAQPGTVLTFSGQALARACGDCRFLATNR